MANLSNISEYLAVADDGRLMLSIHHEPRFVRINDSVIVNVNFVTNIWKKDGSWRCAVPGEEELRITDERVDYFLIACGLQPTEENRP